MRPIGGFSLIPKRKLSDQFQSGGLVKQIVETIKLGGEQADYLKHDYEYDSGWGRDLKLYPKRKLVDLSGMNNLAVLIQHIVGMIPEPITILKIWHDLAIPLPKISLAVAEDHSGGAFTATPSLTIPAPSVTGVAALSWVLVEDCEDAWSEYVQANVTSTADGADYQIGSASAKMAAGTDAAVGRLATEDITSANLTSYNYLRAWVKSSVTITSGDIAILLDDHAECVSPTEDLNMGDLVANTWTQVSLAFDTPANLGAIISIGIDMKNDKGAFNFWIDQVRATEGE